jgi:hypothetical protein
VTVVVIVVAAAAAAGNNTTIRWKGLVGTDGTVSGAHSSSELND